MSISAETPFEWDIGTAYDFFLSLSVLHNPEKYGLRGSWAAGVRSRLALPERELMQRFVEIIWPLQFAHHLPEPKNAQIALQELRRIPAAERLIKLFPKVPEHTYEFLDGIRRRGRWNNEDLGRMVTIVQKSERPKSMPAAQRKVAADVLDMWLDIEAVGEQLVSALNSYYNVFFAEEEARLQPVLQKALQRAQEMATTMPLPQLVEELSQGVRLEKTWGYDAYVMAPIFWTTPFLAFGQVAENKGIILFGARPSDASLIPGEAVPDGLYQVLKALADPTRLRILRYLEEQPRTPAELSRLLRLRAPTVIHHLDALRLARLVVISLEAEGKRYATRPGAVDAAYQVLQSFLSGSPISD